MRVVPVNSIKGEAYLATDIFNDKGNTLLKKGVLLTPILLGKLQENNVFTVYIQDKYSQGEIHDIIQPELRQKTVTAVMDVFKQIEKSNKELRENTSDLRKNLLIRQMDHYIKDFKLIAKSIIDELTSNPGLLINLVDIKNIDTYTYQHSVNVGILSLVIGIEMKLNRTELQPLFLSALLHDVGKALIPKEIVHKKGALEDSEMEMMKNHAYLGYQYLRENFSNPISVTNGVHQHHERIDGSGYPRGLLGAQIGKFAKIIAIADTYDAMTSDTPYSRAISPNEVIEFLMGSASTHFDYEMVVKFTRCIVPYPEGTYVKINGGRTGVVEQATPNYPLRPRVRIISKESLDFNSQYDLMERKELVIEGIIYEFDQDTNHEADPGLEPETDSN